MGKILKPFLVRVWCLSFSPAVLYWPCLMSMMCLVAVESFGRLSFVVIVLLFMSFLLSKSVPFGVKF